MPRQRYHGYSAVRSEIRWISGTGTVGVALLFSDPGDVETPDGVDGGGDLAGVVHRFSSSREMAGMLRRNCIPASGRIRWLEPPDWRLSGQDIVRQSVTVRIAFEI